MAEYFSSGNVLAVGMKVGTAICIDLTENFATLEDSGPIIAGQLQWMYDAGWKQMFPPSVESHPSFTNTMQYHYNFHKEEYKL